MATLVMNGQLDLNINITQNKFLRMICDKDLSIYTRDELEEECRHLQLKCKQLSDASDKDAQRIYELKRSLETATAAEAYLSAELEQLTLNTQQQHLNTKLQSEHEELRRKHNELSAEFTSLQDEYGQILSENSNLRTKLDSIGVEKAKNSNAEVREFGELLKERLNVLEQENMELLQKLDEQRADKMQQTMALAEKDKKIEIMQDEVSCLEENMRFKREELEEKSRLLESAQEQLFEANSKINMLMSSPDNKDRKGNSLFAEVDDQRQAMKQLLAAQKKTFQEMKKTYDESQYEIRRLKRENRAIHTELQACSSIFYNADRTYHDKLTNRIKYLLKQNEDLEEKLRWMQKYLKDLASDKGVLWLDSMFNFCKQETDDLKKQMHSLRIKNASLEEQLRNAQQDTVRWRFEALKSRCVLIDRENLLNENKIAFKSQNAVEYTITESEEKIARPRIMPAEPLQKSENSTIKIDKSQSNKDIRIHENQIETSQSKDSLNSSSIPLEVQLNETIDCNKENRSVEKFSENKIECNSSTSSESNLSSRKILKEVSLHSKVESGETLSKKPLDPKMKSVTLPSILCKQRDALPTYTEKNVKFATNETRVYILPENADIVKDDSENHENIQNSSCENITKHGSQPESNVRTVRTKSNVIIRRFVVGSKNK